MSMVIAGGKKTTFKSMEEVIAWARKIRPEMQEIAQDKMDKRVARAAMSVITSIYSYKKIPKKFNLVLSKRYSEAEIKPGYSLSLQAEGEVYSAAKYDVCNMERNPDIDFRSELVVIPHKGEFYAIWYGEDRRMEALVDDQPEMLEFWYDGRTDGPEDMEYEEYSARGDVWNEIFEDYAQPNEVGVTVDLLGKIPMSRNDDVIVGYMKDRREGIIREIAKYDDPTAYQDWLKLDPENIKLDEECKDTTSLSAYFKYKKWAENEGKPIIDKYIKQHENTFPSEDKFKDLLTLKLTEVFKIITGEEYEPDEHAECKCKSDAGCGN